MHPPIALGLFLALALASCGQQLVASAPSTPAHRPGQARTSRWTASP